MIFSTVPVGTYLVSLNLSSSRGTRSWNSSKLGSTLVRIGTFYGRPQKNVYKCVGGFFLLFLHVDENYTQKSYRFYGSYHLGTYLSGTYHVLLTTQVPTYPKFLVKYLYFSSCNNKRSPQVPMKLSTQVPVPILYGGYIYRVPYVVPSDN